MSAQELDELRQRERELWEACNRAQAAYERARDAWVEVKHQVDAADLEALIEARVANRLGFVAEPKEAA